MRLGITFAVGLLGLVLSFSEAEDTLVKFDRGIGVDPVSNAPGPGAVAATVTRNIVRGVQPPGAPWVIAELKANKRPSNMAEDEALVYDFVTELTTTQKVSDETYARAKKIFNDQQIVDLTSVAGNYVMVAMVLAMAEQSVPPDKEEPFKVGEK